MATLVVPASWSLMPPSPVPRCACRAGTDRTSGQSKGRPSWAPIGCRTYLPAGGSTPSVRECRSMPRDAAGREADSDADSCAHTHTRPADPAARSVPGPRLRQGRGRSRPGQPGAWRRSPAPDPRDVTTEAVERQASAVAGAASGTRASVASAPSAVPLASSAPGCPRSRPVLAAALSDGGSRSTPPSRAGSRRRRCRPRPAARAHPGGGDGAAASVGARTFTIRARCGARRRGERDRRRAARPRAAHVACSSRRPVAAAP